MPATRRLASGLLTALLTGTALLATGCSGGATTAAAGTDAAASGAAGGDARAAYQRCLQDNGVTLPSMPAGGDGQAPGGTPSGMPGGQPGALPSGVAPSGGPGGGALPSGVDASAFAAAQEACASLRPTAGAVPGAPGAGQAGATAGATGAAGSSQLAAFRTCMADHGVTVPEGQPRLDTADAATAKALETCGALLPATATPTPSPSAT